MFFNKLYFIFFFFLRKILKIWEIWEYSIKIWEEIWEIWEMWELWEIWKWWAPCSLFLSLKESTRESTWETMKNAFYFTSKAFCSQQGIIQKKYGRIVFWRSQNDCTWGSEGPRVMPWWMRGCEVPELFLFFSYKTC